MEEFDPDDEGYWKMEELENYSKSYECNGKLSRIWRNGVNLGKKVVITGVVVSSAPFVLPPLVALSAIGVAFSVPAGFVFATYACGEKLMNTLLPISNPYEEDGIVFCDDEECRAYRDNVDRWWYEEDEDLEVEELEFEEDVKKGLEMRIEFVEDNNEEYHDHDRPPGYMDERNKRSSNVIKIIEEGYGENVGEYVAVEEQLTDSKVYCEILGGITEVATETSLMEKEGVWEPKVSEIVEVDYGEDVEEYMADEEQPIDEEVPKLLEGMIKEAEDEISLMEKEEDRLLSVSENFDEEYEEDAGEYMVNQEHPLDATAVPEILERMEAVENDISLMEKEDDQGTRVLSEIVEDRYKEDSREYVMADEERPLDAYAIPEILEGMKGAKHDISLMEKKGQVLRESEVAEEGYGEDVGEYMEDEEKPLDAKEIPETVEVEVTEEVEYEIFLTEKEEGWVPEVSEIVDKGYEDVEEYIENEEQPLDAKDIPDILEGIKEAESEISLTQKEEGQGLRLSEVVMEEYNENAGEYITDEEQFLDAKEIPELLEGIKEAENVNSMMERDSRVPSVSEIGEEEFKDVEEYMSDEEKPLDAKAILEILEETKEAANEESLMEKEEGGMPRDSLSSIATQLGGENEINIVQVAEGTTFVSPRGIEEENEFTGVEKDELRIDSTTLIEEIRNKVGDDQKGEDSPVNITPKGNEESGRVSVKDLSQDKGNKHLTISKKVEPAIDDKGLKIGLEGEKNEEEVTEDMSISQAGNINEGNGFSGLESEELRSETMGLIEKLRGEGKVDQKRNESPVKETSEGDELSGVVSVKEMSQNNGKKNLTIPEVVELASVKNENNVKKVAEDMVFVPSTDIKEENGFAVVEVEELRSEMTNLIEERDEGSAGQKRKDSVTKGTPEEHAEPGKFLIEPMSEEKGSTTLAVIPKGLEPATNDKQNIFDLSSEVNLKNTSIERDEPRSAVENQLLVTVKIDNDHTVTEVHQGTSSDNLGNLILSNEDTRETPVKGEFSVLDNRTATPHQIVDSFNKMLEGEDQSSNNVWSSVNMVEVTEVSADYHEVTIESTMPVSGYIGEEQSLNNMAEVAVDYDLVIRSALPMSEHAEIAKDQGSTAGSDKVKQDEDKIWEEINAMRTIVGYTNAPHLSCAEELKALYDFTGVELPTSSNDSSDLADINEKLHFLMSIIGVK